jgi:enhancing lycopene biosynthesis protein 2
MAKKKIGVLLAGCGVKDGSEIHEATLTLYFLDKYGAEAVCMSPNKDLFDVVNHITEKPMNEKRNAMVEAARIARGNIRDVKTVKAGDIDAIVIPGGYGSAKNLCTYAQDGVNCRADEDVARLLGELHRAKKPIGALCIAPALIARLFGKEFPVELTIGPDPGTAAAMEKMGARHKNAKVNEIVDAKNKIVTTPCHSWRRASGSRRRRGKLVAKILEMV